jgi:hypothetical protein
MTNRILNPRAARFAAYRYHRGRIVVARDGEHGELHDFRALHRCDDGGRA